jgi:hypothetical protein
MPLDSLVIMQSRSVLSSEVPEDHDAGCIGESVGGGGGVEFD